MAQISYVLKRPLLNFSTGEELIHDAKWREWTRKKDDTLYTKKGTTSQAEVIMLLDHLVNSRSYSILEPKELHKRQHEDIVKSVKLV